MYYYALKIYAILINNLFIYKEFFFNIHKPNPIKNILFSEKEWWNFLLQKGPHANGYNTTFSKFAHTNINSYDLVVPLTIPDLEFCMLNENKLNKNAIPFPSTESFNICNDKIMFGDFMENNGFSEYLPTQITENTFPFILKKKSDEGGENTFIIKNYFDIDLHKEAYNSPEYLKQCIVKGEREYTTHIIIKDGKILNALTIVYIFKNPIYIKGKDRYICRNVSKNKHIETFEQILQKMNFNGLCCFNYKEVNGVPIVLEINPRFGGSLCNFFYPFLQKVI
jgi:hypothetical protein